MRTPGPVRHQGQPPHSTITIAATALLFSATTGAATKHNESAESASTETRAREGTDNGGTENSASPESLFKYDERKSAEDEVLFKGGEVDSDGDGTIDLSVHINGTHRIVRYFIDGKLTSERHTKSGEVTKKRIDENLDGFFETVETTELKENDTHTILLTDTDGDGAHDKRETTIRSRRGTVTTISELRDGKWIDIKTLRPSRFQF